MSRLSRRSRAWKNIPYTCPILPRPQVKKAKIRQRVRQLMDSTDDLTRSQFNTLALTTDGDLDVLLKRLNVLCPEAQMDHRVFDNFMLLCSVIRGMVRVR